MRRNWIATRVAGFLVLREDAVARKAANHVSIKPNKRLSVYRPYVLFIFRSVSEYAQAARISTPVVCVPRRVRVSMDHSSRADAEQAELREKTGRPSSDIAPSVYFILSFAYPDAASASRRQ